MTGLVAGVGVRAMLASAGGFLKAIPRQVWIGIVIIAALVAGVLYHHHIAHKALKAADAAGYARARAEDNAALAKAHDQALADKKRADLASAKITDLERQSNDATATDIRSRADALRLWRPAPAIHRGQGDNPGVPASPGGSEPTSGAGSPAAVTVDWSWLVDTAESCDLNRAEVLTWRSWYSRQTKAWVGR